MYTAASRLYLGLFALGVGGGLLYWATSDAGINGPAPEWWGVTLFGGLALVGLLLGSAMVVTRDGTVTRDDDQDPAAALAPSPMATQTSVFPAVAALGTGLVALGVVAGIEWVIVGAVVGAIGVLEWATVSWSERISGDPTHNRSVRASAMLPVEIPIGVTLIVAAMAISLSRVLLAVSVNASVVAAGVVATVVLIVGSVVALRPSISPAAVRVVVALGAVGLFGGGIAGAVVGERDIEAHHADHAPAVSDDHAEPAADHE